MKAKRKEENNVEFTNRGDFYQIPPLDHGEAIDPINREVAKRRGTTRPRFITSSISESALLDALPLTWMSCRRTHRLSRRQFATLLELDKPKRDHYPIKTSVYNYLARQ